MASTHDERTPGEDAGFSSPVRDDAEIGAITDVGRVRDENQDHYGLCEATEDEEYFAKGRLLVVCDGMGGHNGGTVASRTTVDYLLKSFEEMEPGEPRQVLETAIRTANDAVHGKQAQDPALRNMGTTLVAMLTLGEHVHIAHVGDSRAYIFRDGQATQISKDHTYLNELIDIGLLTPEKAKNHPERNIITRCVGMDGELRIDWNYREARVGDVFLLCSDGLYNHVEDDEMLEIATTMEAQRACQALCDLANRRGGEDNITVAVLKITSLSTRFQERAAALGITSLAPPPPGSTQAIQGGDDEHLDHEADTPRAGFALSPSDETPKAPTAMVEQHTPVPGVPATSGHGLLRGLRVFIGLQILVLILLLILLQTY